jgi:hypothetical protein
MYWDVHNVVRWVDAFFVKLFVLMGPFTGSQTCQKGEMLP